jgi:threonine aldolase
MAKYSFKDDYSTGCHIKILNMLKKTNLEQQDGYGEDKYSKKAKKLIQNKIQNKKAEIFFVSGGTQANLIVISSLLKSHESVISAKTGHINIHEAGAIESAGHKINTVLSDDGKLTSQQIQEVLNEHFDIPHVVKPKMVYISNSTELGTIYNKNELKNLYKFCKKKNLYLFLDGARLGSALCSIKNDLRLKDIAKYTDIFYIGGTKNGALLGEAIVITKKRFKKDFTFFIKQKGAMLSKGRLLGIQFYVLFKNNLFFSLANHSNKMALKIANKFQENGYKFLTPTVSNQIFPILPNSLVDKLSKKYKFHIWKKINNNHTAIRVVTSWTTSQEKVNDFIYNLK